MKRIVNKPLGDADGMLVGLCAAHADIDAQPSPRVVVRAASPVRADGRSDAPGQRRAGALSLFESQGPGR